MESAKKLKKNSVFLQFYEHKRADGFASKSIDCFKPGWLRLRRWLPSSSLMLRFCQMCIKNIFFSFCIFKMYDMHVS